MSQIQEYQNEYMELSDREVLDELNKQLKNRNSFFNDNAQLKIKALNNLLEERGYYYDGNGKFKRR